ncbi:MAG: ROK family protein [Candidatus Omnitrophota bacterium]
MNKRVKIGIDLGGTRIKIGLVSDTGKVSFRREIDTPVSSNRERLLSAIDQGVSNVMGLSGIKRHEIAGFGIGVPGPVDSEKGIVHYFPNIKGWDNVALASILKKRTGLKVRLDNDVNVMTLAEHRFGAGRGARNLVCLTLGTGVGGGIIINNEIYRGSTMCAGEIGHMPINETGPKCNCGGYGCLERYIGNRYILDISRKVFGKDITLEGLTDLARKGNKNAQGIWKDLAEKLGTALTGVVNLLNPDKIVIGGGVSKAGSFIFKPLRLTVKRRAMRDQARHVRIVKARLGDNAGIIGASLLI